MAPEDPPRLSKDPSKTLHRPSKRRPKTPQDLPKTLPRPAQLFRTDCQLGAKLTVLRPTWEHLGTNLGARSSNILDPASQFLLSIFRPHQRFWSLQDAFLPFSQSFYSFSLIRPGQLVRTNGGFFTFLLLLLHILLVLLLQVGVWKPSWPQVGGPWGHLVSKLGGLGTILAPS